MSLKGTSRYTYQKPGSLRQLPLSPLLSSNPSQIPINLVSYTSLLSVHLICHHLSASWIICCVHFYLPFCSPSFSGASVFFSNEIISSFQSADLIWSSPNLKTFCGTHCSWSKDILPHGPRQPLWPPLVTFFPRLTPSLSEPRFSMHIASCTELLPLLYAPPSPPSLTSSKTPPAWSFPLLEHQDMFCLAFITQAIL